MEDVWITIFSKERGEEKFSRSDWRAIQKTPSRYLYMPKHSSDALTFHRWNGPAVRYADGEEHWWVNGVHVSSFYPYLNKWLSFLS